MATFGPTGTFLTEKVPPRSIARALCMIKGLLKQEREIREMQGELAV